MSINHLQPNSQTQRTPSRDPIGFNGGVNIYLYVKGNPEIQVDPSGRRWIEVPKVNASCRRYKLASGKCNYHCSCHGGTHKVNGENYRYYNRPCNMPPNPPMCYDWEWVDASEPVCPLVPIIMPVVIPDPIKTTPPTTLPPSTGPELAPTCRWVLLSGGVVIIVCTVVEDFATCGVGCL